MELAARLGEPVNHKRVKRILRDNHWSLVRQLPRYRPSGVQRILQKRPSELDLVRGRQFGVLQAVSTDFTELPYAAGSRKAWLIVIHDLVSRWVVAWAVGRRRNRELALECWNQARGRLKRRRGDLTGLIVHQDQDSVFTSYRWGLGGSDPRLGEHRKNHRILCCKGNCRLKVTWACWYYHNSQPGALGIIEDALIAELKPTGQDVGDGEVPSVTLPDYALKRYR